MFDMVPNEMQILLRTSMEERNLAGGEVDMDDEEENKEQELNPFAEDLRRWLSTIRDFCYSSIQLSSYTGSIEFFGLAGLGDSLGASILHQIDAVQLRHYRLIIKKVVLPLIQMCPKSTQPTILGPLLSGFLASLYRRLQTSWEARAATKATAQSTLQQQQQRPSDTQADNQEDILEDVLVRQVTRETIELIDKVVPEPLKANGVPSHVAPMESSSSSAGTSGTDILQYMLSVESISGPFLFTLIGCLSWPDSHTVHKACTVCLRLIPILAGNAQFHQIVGKEIFSAALRGLSGDGSLQDSYNGFMDVARTVYWSLAQQNSDVARQLVLQIPGVTVQMIQELEQKMSKDNKQHKTAFRSFIEGVLKITEAKKQPRKLVNIVNLPEKLVISGTAQTRQQEQDNEAESGLQNLFG